MGPQPHTSSRRFEDVSAPLQHDEVVDAGEREHMRQDETSRAGADNEDAHSVGWEP